MRMGESFYAPKSDTKCYRFLVFDIDANDAVARFPDEYSLEAPKGRRVIDMSMNSGVRMPSEDQAYSSAPSAEPTAPAPEAPAATAKG